MSDEHKVFTDEILDLLDETFEQHHGIYLDKGTSLLQTLEGISSEQASRSASARSATIAAHVKHVSFYLDVLNDYIRNEQVGKVDWREIWRTTQTVTPHEWEAIKQELKESYHRVLDSLEEMETWGENGIAGSLAILAHTAYHLGGIRQALSVIKS